MPDRRLLPLAVALIMACNPSAPILLPNIDAGSAVDGGTTDRSIVDRAADVEVADVPLSTDSPIVDIVLVDVPDVPMAPDVPAVTDVVLAVDVPDAPPTVDIPDVPIVVDGGTCPSGMVLIPAGTFTMGQTGLAEPLHPVQMSAYCMDLTEVTVAAYRMCTAAGCGTPGTFNIYCNWNTPRIGHPVNCLSWDQARAFCQWRGGDLPTEAQWEYAARYADGRTYPWGEQPPAGRSCWARYPAPPGYTCAAGSYPSGNSDRGLSDLAGNVWEWNLDWRAPYVVGPTAVLDPTGPSTGTQRIIRGGGWSNPASEPPYTAQRNSLDPGFRNDNIGFRCARTPM